MSKAVKYILWNFTQGSRSALNIYPHLIQAANSSNNNLVFIATRETILENTLKVDGIYCSFCKLLSCRYEQSHIYFSKGCVAKLILISATIGVLLNRRIFRVSSIPTLK